MARPAPHGRLGTGKSLSFVRHHLNLPRTLAIASLVTLAAPAFANLVWPALYLETRLLSWWAIALGLLVEFVVIQRLFALTTVRALKADVGANLGSALLGVPLIPIAGIVWELFPGSIYMSLLSWGTFNPVTWGATYVLACLINAAVESLILRRYFKLTIARRHFLILVAANALSVGAAFASLYINPVKP